MLLHHFALMPQFLLEGGIPPYLRQSYRAWLHHKKSTRKSSIKANPAGTKVAREAHEGRLTISGGKQAPSIAWRNH